MEIKLQPNPINAWPLKGIFIQSDRVAHWLHELQRMELTPETTRIYPVPGTIANSVSGCLVISEKEVAADLLNRNVRCQQMHSNLYIPEKTTLFPQLNEEELQQFFGQHTWFFHPETGLSECTEVLSPSSHFTCEIQEGSAFKRPEEGVHLPSTIKSFQVKPVAPEQIMQEFQEGNQVGTKPLKDEPLNVLEKIKLGFYRLLSAGNKRGGAADGTNNSASESKGRSGARLKESFFDKLMRKIGMERLANRMINDLEELERRNSKAIDRLMELFEKNPLEALRFAMPLDEGGTSRGGDYGQLDFSRRWGSFSSGGSGSAIISSDHYSRLRERYEKQAQDFIEQGDFRNAALVYIKLLKSPASAAAALEKGHLYQEAAALYLDTRVNNKEKAAECYTKGRMYTEAIRIYNDLQLHRKSAELYTAMGQTEQASKAYTLHVNSLIESRQYINAAEIYQQHLNNIPKAREVLMTGWKEKKEAIDCMKNYLSLENDLKERSLEAERIATDLKPTEVGAFLTVVEHFYNNQDDQPDGYRELAFKLVAENISTHPNLIEQLRPFNKENKHFAKETLRFMQWRRTNR